MTNDRMKLIAALGHQLGGHPEWQGADPGTRFVLNFRPQRDLRSAV